MQVAPYAKRTVAIATIVSFNYGNRLQNYALQEVLQSSFGLRARTLLPVGTTLGYRVKVAAKRLLHPFFPEKRWACYARFNACHVRFASQTIDDYRLGDAGFDCFVIGSDQVWNPDFSFTSEAEYLPQVPRGKKVAYAASFGVDEIVENRERTAQLLRGIRAISTRETAGAAIVRDLTARDAPTVLDPTMLLTLEQWEAVARRPRMELPLSGYCLKYVLGEDANAGAVEELASARGFDIVDLADVSLPVGPAEFVWLVCHASLVCTDSFHASVFSILFHRPFVIFERQSRDKDMSSRIDTLCRTFGCGGHRYSKGEYCPEGVFSVDWARVEAVLASERARSADYLARALGR